MPRHERPEHSSASCRAGIRQQSSELSDFSVCTTWGIKGRRPSPHVLRKKMEYPGAQARGPRTGPKPVGASVVLIEEWASGTQLIQELLNEGLWRYPRDPEADKTMRLHAQTATIENGFVYLPQEASWLAEYLHELTFPQGKER